MPEDAVLYPPCAARFLMERAQKAGSNASSWSFRSRRSGQGRVRMTDGSEISARIIVNAAGAGAADLTPGLEIKKRKGHLVITDRYPGFLRHQLVELGYLKSAHSISSDSVAFNVQPRRTGQILLDLRGNTVRSTRKWTAGYWCACCNVRRNTCRAWRRCRRSAPGLDFVLRLRTSFR